MRVAADQHNDKTRLRQLRCIHPEGVQTFRNKPRLIQRRNGHDNLGRKRSILGGRGLGHAGTLARAVPPV